jgi:hypothetical protein
LPSDEQTGIAQQVDALDVLCITLESLPTDPTAARPLLAEAHGIALRLFSDAATHPNGPGGRVVGWYRDIHARLATAASRHGLHTNPLGWSPS